MQPPRSRMTNIIHILLIFRGAIEGKLRYMFLGIVLAVIIRRAIARASWKDMTLYDSWEKNTL